MATLTSVSVSSQNSLPIKTTHNGKNAVIISEAQMDSISITYLNLNLLKSKSESLSITIERINKELEKSFLSQEYFKKDNQNLSQIIEKNKDRFENQSKLHNAELLYYKEKAKGKFNYFIYGTVLGGLVVGILTLL